MKTESETMEREIIKCDKCENEMRLEIEDLRTRLCSEGQLKKAEFILFEMMIKD